MRPSSTAPSVSCAASSPAWKDGVYEGEAFLDDDGHKFKDIHIRARVTKRGSDLEIDLTDSHPQVTGFINSSFANTHSAVVVALSYLIDPDIPKNDGAFRPIKVKLKEGTIVWPRPGAPVTLCTNHCGQEIIEAIIKRAGAGMPRARDGGLGPALPHRHRRASTRARASHSSGICSRRGPAAAARRRVTAGRAAGEWQAAGGIKFGSMEVQEVRFPLLLPPPRVPPRQRRRRALSRRARR